MVLARAANPDFSWEQTKKLEMALEMGLFDNRVLFNLVWYQNRSDNQLLDRPLASTTGFGTLQFNLPALVENRGVEFDITTRNIQSENFNWTTSFNISRERNELKEFSNIENFAVFDNRYIVGESLFGQKSYESLGINPETGQYAIVDANGDGIISVLDRQDFVDNQQDFYGGLNNSFSWKGFQLDVSLFFVKRDAPDFQSSFTAPGGGGGFSNQPVEVLNRWQNPGELTSYPRFGVGAGSDLFAYNNHHISNRARVDASFIRLQNIALSYDLPEKIREQWNLSRARFSIRAQNLFTITRYQGLDPETQGLSIPPLQIITTGLQLTF